MNMRRLAVGTATWLLYACAIHAGAGEAIPAVTGKLTGNEMSRTLSKVEARGAA